MFQLKSSVARHKQNLKGPLWLAAANLFVIYTHMIAIDKTCFLRGSETLAFSYVHEIILRAGVDLHWLGWVPHCFAVHGLAARGEHR